jgi:hypothetical protein
MGGEVESVHGGNVATATALAMAETVRWWLWLYLLLAALAAALGPEGLSGEMVALLLSIAALLFVVYVDEMYIFMKGEIVKG